MNGTAEAHHDRRLTVALVGRSCAPSTGKLSDRVSAILFEEDPIGINFADNTDKYQPEVDTILPRLKTCHTVADGAGRRARGNRSIARPHRRAR